MQRKVVQSLVVICILLLLVGGSLTVLRGAVRADRDPLVALDGDVVPQIHRAHFKHLTDSNQQLNLSIGLTPNNLPQLDNLLQGLYDPQSPNFHQFLTPDQFNNLFAPTPDQVQQVEDYLQGQGLTVTDVSSNNLLINASSSVSQAQQAFNMQIGDYQNGQDSFYANTSPPELPSGISKLVTSISGLDNTKKYHSHYQQLTTPSGPSGGYGPQDIANAYDIAPLQSAGTLGNNQTIALLELDGYQPTDIIQYLLNYNLRTSLPSISNIMVDGFNGLPGQGAIEVELDMEMLAAVAPHANQLVYEGPNTPQGFNDTLNKIVTDNKARTVSISWGICESASGSAELQTLDNIFKQGAAQGMSFFAAAGDAGAYDCKDTNLAVDSPASDPNVTGVGGTTLQLGTGGGYGSESVWSDPNDFHAPMGAGGGGGISNTFYEPSWQKGPGVQNSYSTGTTCNAPTGTFCREVPDVTANADPNTGYAVYCTILNAGCPSTGWISIAGTSAAAPVWAASTALINQYLQSQGKSPMGLANPALYGLFNSTQTFPAFHDITTGNNLYYPATANYDLASGLGSPDVYNIARDLVANSNSSIIAQDTFQGSNQTYWGTASDGHTWGGDANSLSVFSISGGTGLISGGSTSYNAVLGPVTTNAEVLFTGSLNTFSNANMGAVLRWNDTNDWYKAYIDGNNLVVQKKILGNATVLATAPFAATAGTNYSLRFRIVGATLYAKVWATGGTEPGNWMVTVTSSSLQSGYCGLRMLITGSAVATFTSFQATTAQ